MSRSWKTKLGESHTRTVIKAVSWRIIASGTTMVIVYILTREWTITLGAGLLEGVSKIIFYYLHERIWHKDRVGQKHPSLGRDSRNQRTEA